MHDPDRQIFPEGSITETFGDQSAEFFEKIVSIAPSILYVFDLIEMRNIWVNRSMFLWLGYTSDEIAEMGSGMLETLMHPDDFARYPTHFDRLKTLAPRQVARFEYRVRAKSGDYRWLLSEEMAFTYSKDGEVTQIVGSAHDVSDARSREDKINLLVREMNHRIKNLFTVVLSMITLTVKTKKDAPVEETIDTIMGRVNALAVSQSLSLPSSAESPGSARELVDLILRPYVSTHNIRVSGSDATVLPDQARALAMILHELATNAIKYGSLSAEGGALLIDVGATDEGMFQLTWTEEATFKLPDLAPDTSKGFGSRLIQRSIAPIKGRVDLDWQTGGLHAKIEFPLHAPE